MSIWVKICGNTSLQDALIATEAGADALGFVFAPGPRQATITQVSTITARLPPEVEKIGVFLNSAIGDIELAVQSCALTGVQLHWDVEPETTANLRSRLGPAIRILRVAHFGPETESHRSLRDTNVDAVLIDSRTATAVGGTGVPFDWDSSRALFQNAAASTRLVLAGGLTPANVSEAMTKLHPWGVDVVSGVESQPGRKDREKVRAFIAAARSLVSP